MHPRTQVLVRVAILGGIVALAGCLGLPGSDPQDPATAAGDGAVPDALDGDLPPGCDGNRTALAHHPGGEVAGDPSGPDALPCLTRTGTESFEPTIGLDGDGNVYLHPSRSGDAVGVSKTTDGGATWETLYPQEAGVETHPNTLDPFLHLDPVTDRVFVDDLATVNCSFFSWTDDGGDSWGNSVAGCMETDHQNVFTGPPVDSPTVGYPNIVYRCGLNTVALAVASTSATCQRSLDGGRTWLPPGGPAFVADPTKEGHMGVQGYCDGATGHGTTGPDGNVYLPKGWCGQPWLAISDDEGLTWTRVQVAENGMPRGPAAGYNGLQDHEAGVDVDPDGNVYYLWNAEDRLPYLAVSTDGGETWGDPMMVAPPGVTEVTHPALMVGGVGEVAIAYLGSTNSPGAPFPTCETPDACLTGEGSDRDYSNVTWNGYVALSTDALDDDPVFHSVAANDPSDPLVRGRCGPVNCGPVADFIDVGIGPDGSVWAPFVDGCSEACASDEGGAHDIREGVAGRLWGGPGLERQDGGP